MTQEQFSNAERIKSMIDCLRNENAHLKSAYVRMNLENKASVEYFIRSFVSAVGAKQVLTSLVEMVLYNNEQAIARLQKDFEGI